MTDFLDEKRREITDRLKELKPLVDEFNRLEAAARPWRASADRAASDGRAQQRHPPSRTGTPARLGTRKSAASRHGGSRSNAARKKPGRPPGKRRAGRRKGSGTRAAEALSFVQGQPGITIPELAAKMGIKQNYLYRVLPGLEQEKKVEKKGRGWYPKS